MFFRRGLLPLLVGAAVGAIEIFVARQGAQTRPTIGLVILAIGAVAGFLPLRFTLPIAVVLGCNEGFLVYFVGGMGRYWKEALVVGLVLRAVRRKAPNFVEVAALAGLLAITIGYELAGSTSTEAAWGFKLLVLFAIAGWAVARLGPGAREWLAMYWGLSVVVAGAIPFALWQRSVGVQGLMNLGYPYGVTIRVANGSLRAFAGFTYGAPFAYTLVVAALCWVALVLTRQRALTRATSWVPVFAAIGIILSLNRIALVGTAAAIAVVLGSAPRRSARRGDPIDRSRSHCCRRGTKRQLPRSGLHVWIEVGTSTNVDLVFGLERRGCIRKWAEQRGRRVRPGCSRDTPSC